MNCHHHFLKDWRGPYHTIVLSTTILVTLVNIFSSLPETDARILPVQIQIPLGQNRCTRARGTALSSSASIIKSSSSAKRCLNPIITSKNDASRIGEISVTEQKRKRKKLLLRPRLRTKGQWTAKCFNFWTRPPLPPGHPASLYSYLPAFLSDWIFVGSTMAVRPPPSRPPSLRPSPALHIGVGDPSYIDKDHYPDYYYETYYDDYEYSPPPDPNYPNYYDYYDESGMIDYNSIDDYTTNNIDYGFTDDYYHGSDDTYNDFDSNDISTYDFSSGSEDFSTSDLDYSVTVSDDDYSSSSDSYSESSSSDDDYDY